MSSMQKLYNLRNEKIIEGYIRQIVNQNGIMKIFPTELNYLCSCFYQPLMIHFRKKAKEILEVMPKSSVNNIYSMLCKRKMFQMFTEHHHGFQFAFQIRADPEVFDEDDRVFIRFGIVTTNVPENVEKHDGTEWSNSNGFVKNCHWSYSFVLQECAYRHGRCYQIVSARDDKSWNDYEYGETSLTIPIPLKDDEREIDFKVFINILQWNTNDENNDITFNNGVKMKSVSGITWNLMGLADRYEEIRVIGDVNDKRMCRALTGGAPASDLSDDGCFYVELDSLAGNVRMYWYNKPTKVRAIATMVTVIVSWDDGGSFDGSKTTNKADWKCKAVNWGQFRGRGSESYGLKRSKEMVNSQIIMAGLADGRKVKEIEVVINVVSVWGTNGHMVKRKDWHEVGVNMVKGTNWYKVGA